MVKRIVLPIAVAAMIVPFVNAGAAQAVATPPRPLHPPVGAGTSFVDHAAKLAGMADPDWYEANIPFVDLPDAAIEDTYYYRWRTYKEALKYTGPADGWIVSEFLGPVGYAAPGGAISAAAGHHMYEGRWLRDQRYLDDYTNYWLTGPGSGPKPATEGLGKDTTDWAHQYSFWVADAVLARAKVSGRLDEAAALLPELERQWKNWAPQYNSDLGLYWQTPVWDAMEFTASSYQSDDPYHGGDGYRPTLNAYQYGDAMAISELARVTGDTAKADAYAASARALQQAQEKYLWDPSTDFYKHVMRDDNPDHTRIVDREEIGYIPWYFHMAPAANDVAWSQLMDPQGFKADFGPTTVERRSPYFMKDAEEGCCRWSGPSWPYATSQTLTALGNLLTDYPAQDYVKASDFTRLLHEYALTQRKNGQPYVAEAHHPDQDRWLYDGFNHSEDYNHSTYNDIVLSTLVGIRAQDGDSVRIDPQVGAGWDHFAAENVPYHGHNLTVVWDADGTHYSAGAGMSVFQDGVRIHTQPQLGDVTVAFGAAGSAASVLAHEADDAANQSGVGYPSASASYSWRTDPPTEATDGQEFQLDIPSTRWTTYQSPNASDWLQVDFGVATPVDDVRTVFYSDGGGVKLPQSYDVEYRDRAGAWATLPGQHRDRPAPIAGAVDRITLDTPVVTDAIRLVGQNQPGSGFGVTSFGSWRGIDRGLIASIDTAADGSIAVSPGAATTVTTHLTIGAGSAVAEEALLAPPGWTVKRMSPSLTGATAGDHRSTWSVTAPAGFDRSRDYPLRYLVTSPTGLTASALATARWVFDDAAFGATVWDDDFTSDRLAEYRPSGSLGEPAPTSTVNTSAGTLDVSAATRARGLFSVPVTAGDSFAIVVEPASFAAGAPEENSLFLGSAGGPDDIAMSWYNHSKQQGGVNVVTAGNGHPEAEGAGSTTVAWNDGDRFATVVTDGTLTSWVEKSGQWSRLSSAPVNVAVPNTTLAQWAPSFSVRLDAGTVSLDRVTVLDGDTPLATSSTDATVRPGSITYGRSASVAVHVTGATGRPGGTVDVLSDGAVIGSGMLGRSGRATVTLPHGSLLPGVRHLVVQYRGDTAFAASSDSVELRVEKARSVLRADAADGSVREGASVVITAKVTASVPATGTVTVSEGSVVLATGEVVNGRSTITLSALAVGRHDLTVVYGGSATVEQASAHERVTVTRKR